jgi:hypothetical protein
MSWLIAPIGLLVLGGCSAVAPTPVPSEAWAPSPPEAIRASMSSRGAEFSPVTDADATHVLVEASDAQEAAVAAGERHRPPLVDVGFTYLGLWTPPPQSLGHATVPPPVAAYVVQLSAETSGGPDSGPSTAFAVVDAETGSVIVLFDDCVGPDCLSATGELTWGQDLATNGPF